MGRRERLVDRPAQFNRGPGEDRCPERQDRSADTLTDCGTQGGEPRTEPKRVPEVETSIRGAAARRQPLEADAHGEAPARERSGNRRCAQEVNKRLGPAEGSLIW